jgi:hypothetical protein
VVAPGNAQVLEGRGSPAACHPERSEVSAFSLSRRIRPALLSVAFELLILNV